MEYSFNLEQFWGGLKKNLEHDGKQNNSLRDIIVQFTHVYIYN